MLCYITEKLDGSSVTYYYKNGEFGVCSRNLELLETDDNTLWKVARQLEIEEKLKSLNGNYAIQGEIIGESIQSNKYKLRGQTIFFFNMFDIDKYRYLNFEEFRTTIEQLKLKTVPLLDTEFKLISDINELVKLSTGISKLHKVKREGIVIRPVKETQGSIGRLSFKAINPEFLLKYE